ncbi:MAG TPA: hypothetical protein DCL90_00055, partial [Shigella sp.]|nr:hypothetical protein [Shigella sp.]
MTESFAQL